MSSVHHGRIAILTIQLICLLSSEIHASYMKYSWGGRLVSYDDVSPDPWLIGDDGAEFLLEITVGNTAADYNSSQIPFAAFAAQSSRLWIDGQEALFKGDAYIDFASIDGIADIVSGGGLFTLFDNELEITSVVQLSQDTFTFFRERETPPHFFPTYSTGQASSGRPPYATVVYAGSLVTVVPEPACMFLISYGMLAAVLTRRWQLL